MGSLPAELQGKPKNTGVDSLSLLQWIFPTQELNWDLLHCTRILYQLSYQGSPSFLINSVIKYNFWYFYERREAGCRSMSTVMWPGWQRKKKRESRSVWEAGWHCCWWNSLLFPAVSFCVHAKLLQSRPALCYPMGYSTPASSAHWILQARILEWVAEPFSRGSSQPRDGTHFSSVSCIGIRVLYHLGSCLISDDP